MSRRAASTLASGNRTGEDMVADVEKFFAPPLRQGTNTETGGRMTDPMAGEIVKTV